MRIRMNTRMTLSTTLLALLLATAITPGSQASTASFPDPSVNRHVYPQNGGGGKDGTETHGRSAGKRSLVR